MACGKSTLGRQHAAAAKKEFTDLDTVFIEETGKSPAAYIMENGEPAFRRAEKQLLHQVVERWQSAGKPATLIACGGGTPCFFDNLAFMKKHGRVVFIDTPTSVLWERIGREPEKWPLATRCNLPELYNKRKKWYHRAHERLIP
ncbi:MAG: shikimate kinase [Bacteroidales bacterium]